MNDLEILKYQMFRRVEVFGMSHAALFEDNSLGSKLFADVGAIVAELNDHGAAQVSGNGSARQSTTQKAFIRQELRDALTDIIRTARSISIQKPGFANKFRGQIARNDQILLAAARAIADIAAPLADDFIQYEMPANFLEELKTNIELFEKAVSNQNTAIIARISATAGINVVIDRGLKTVKQLDAIMRNKFKKDPGVLASWFSASRREKVPRSAAAKKSVD